MLTVANTASPNMGKPTLMAPRTNQLRFGALLAFDLTASPSDQGHLRAQVIGGDGLPVPGLLFDGPGTPKGQMSATALVEGIYKVLQQLKQKYTDQKPSALGVKLDPVPDPAKDPITHVIGFTPGQHISNVVLRMNNLKDATTSKPLTHIDFNPLVPRLLQTGQTASAPANLPAKAAASALSLNMYNDVMGGLVDSVQRLSADKRLPDGRIVGYFCISGGMGVAEANITPYGEFFRTGEVGQIHKSSAHWSEHDCSASASGFLRQFVKKLPLSSEARQQITQSGNGDWVFSDDLMNKYFPTIPQPIIINARQQAVTRLLSCLMQTVGIKLMEGMTDAVLTGKLVQGLCGYIEAHPGDFTADLDAFGLITPLKNADLPVHHKIMLGRLWMVLPPAGQAFLKQKPLKLITHLPISGNIGGAHALQKVKPVGQSLDWMFMPAPAFPADKTQKVSA
jgi:hypothetical protein